MRILLLFLLVSTGLFANSQASRSDTIKMICKNWKIKEMKVDGLDQDGKEDLEDMIKYTRIEFKSDMTTTDPNGEVYRKGKWALDKSGKILSLISDDEDIINLEIIFLSSSVLRFKAKGPTSAKFGTGTLIPAKK